MIRNYFNSHLALTITSDSHTYRHVSALWETTFLRIKQWKMEHKRVDDSDLILIIANPIRFIWIISLCDWAL